MSTITDDRLNPVWHRMLYSCTHMATVGFKGLIILLKPKGRFTEAYKYTNGQWQYKNVLYIHATNA